MPLVPTTAARTLQSCRSSAHTLGRHRRIANTQTEVTMRKSHKLDVAILALLSATPTYDYDLRAALPALGFPFYVKAGSIY